MKQIIVLTTFQPYPGQNGINFAMWASVPTARQFLYAKDSTWQSVYSSVTTTELASLRAGEFTEQIQTVNLPIGTPVATVKSVLIDAFNIFQTSVTNATNWQFYGTFFEGTVWTTGGF